ncbi:MAG: hypothetical protein UY21_C0001G0119 [Microgenomates group bacterium GW2011_GWA1_48_10]|nr:MAG: hypothetical protein UY21_C0001G0119 [Microgenomates group bacterium GW2011_GWA1_48_10]
MVLLEVETYGVHTRLRSCSSRVLRARSRALASDGSKKVYPATAGLFLGEVVKRMDYQGYCVKDRKKVTIKDGKIVTWKNGRRAYVGKCPDCGTTVARVLGKA